MRLSEITSTADKLRLYQAKKTAKLAQYKAAQERYRQQVQAYDEKAAKPRKPGQVTPKRPSPPKPPILPKPPQS